jgi:hypothetical protein
MPRDGAIIFRDIVGKLDVLNVEWPTAGARWRGTITTRAARRVMTAGEGAALRRLG